MLFSVSAFAQKVPSKIEFAGLKLHLSDKLRDDLQKEVDMLTVSPKYFQIKVDRAKIYFPIIEQIFAEEELPDDFKYLVLQESALIPDAVSVSNAVGYWQFKDFTAMEMGMRIDRQVDERMHIVASTYGAARYMKKNNSFFDNWLYALQAYQMGAGGALKVVDDKYYGAKSMDLDHNTYWYVKKFLAHKIAFESAVEGNGTPILSIYENGSNKSLEEIAEETSADYDQLLAYNMWLKAKRIPDDKEYPVVLPVGGYKTAQPVNVNVEKTEPSVIPQKVIIAEENKYPVFDTRKLLFSREEVMTINGIQGMVGKNENTLIDLAVRADMSLSKFMRINDLDIKDQPQEGQVYYLKRKKAKAATYYHIVKEGESLWEISQRYGVRLNKLLLKNRLYERSDIKPGLVLWLRHVRPESVPAEYKEIKEDVNKPTDKIIMAEPKAEEKEINKTASVKKEPAIELSEKEPVSEQPEKVTKEPAASIEAVSEANESSEAVKVDSTVEVNILAKDEIETEIEETQVPVEDIVKKDSTILKEEALYKPVNTAAVKNEVSAVEKDVDEGPENFVSHVIEPGETFYSISKKYQVEVVDVLTWNNLSINDKLTIGQEIKILQKKPVDDKQEVLNLQSGTSKQEDYHQVRDGETLYQIARKYQVTIQQLMEWNEKKDYSLSAGEKLIIKK